MPSLLPPPAADVDEEPLPSLPLDSLSKLRTKQSIHGRPIPLTFILLFNPRLIRIVSSSMTKSHIACSVEDLIRGTDVAIDSPMASLKGAHIGMDVASCSLHRCCQC